MVGVTHKHPGVALGAEVKRYGAARAGRAEQGRVQRLRRQPARGAGVHASRTTPMLSCTRGARPRTQKSRRRDAAPGLASREGTLVGRGGEAALCTNFQQSAKAAGQLLEFTTNPGRVPRKWAAREGRRSGLLQAQRRHAAA